MPPIYIETGKTVGVQSAIGLNVFIEHDCQIGDDVTIQEAVVLNDAKILTKMTIKDQVVY
jgi:UDP-3-O-[3-hydroxymyristoyl] glucosamine N-acyltransferase